MIEKRKAFRNFLRTDKGKIYKTHLIEKLLTLILNKSASLDPSGIGVEMEADKPGWCDSLNGLPALFGSSVCETFEIKRTCLILLDSLKQLREKGVTVISLCSEVYSFLLDMLKLLKSYVCADKKMRDYFWWDESNIMKEKFRERTFYSVSGEGKDIELEKLEEFLRMLISKLDMGIKRARDKKSGLWFTYFTYEVQKYCLKDNHVRVLAFTGRPLPLFLEGAVHGLRVDGGHNTCRLVKKSELFDKKLKMYRLNASLENQPLEIGRSRVFVPGWLENESIWLHMEYKYLLEILKNGFYNEFFKDFYNCGVCFFNPDMYGRSILENSSFIVSSVYPDQNLWGKGFVARLSGATVELLNIWVILCLGRKPFFIDESGRLTLKFSPILKADFFTTSKQTVNFKQKNICLDKNTFSFKLFSSILVVYHNPARKDTFRSDCKVKKIVVHSKGKKTVFNCATLSSPYSQAVREAKIDKIDVYLA
jgi:hypothetical protein